MKPENRSIYQAPLGLVAVFYLLVVGWTIFSVPLLVAKIARSEITDLFQWVMIIGVLGFTWYFSLSIYYRVGLGPDGELLLKGVRRGVSLHPRDIESIEGPYLPFGFVRFKSGRERSYLICWVKDPVLLAILKRVGETNPGIRFKTR